MGSVRVSEVGRSDQEGVSHVEYSPEQLLNPNAAPSPDMGEYEMPDNQCVQMTLAGGRCRSLKKPGNDLCHLHAWKEPVDEQD